MNHQGRLTTARWYVAHDWAIPGNKPGIHQFSYCARCGAVRWYNDNLCRDQFLSRDTPAVALRLADGSPIRTRAPENVEPPCVAPEAASTPSHLRSRHIDA